MKRFRSLFAQSGDTIIEVVLAITVMSLIIGGAAVLANRNTRSLQSAQEHSVGLRIAQMQIEQLKAYAAENGAELASLTGDANRFCLTSTGLVESEAVGSNCKGLNSAGTAVTDGSAAYTYYITLTPVFVDGYNAVITVHWGALTNATDQIQLVYRLYKDYGAAAAVDVGDTCPAGQRPNPIPNATPFCVPL